MLFSLYNISGVSSPLLFTCYAWVIGPFSKSSRLLQCWGSQKTPEWFTFLTVAQSFSSLGQHSVCGWRPFPLANLSALLKHKNHLHGRLKPLVPWPQPCQRSASFPDNLDSGGKPQASGNSLSPTYRANGCSFVGLFIQLINISGGCLCRALF